MKTDALSPGRCQMRAVMPLHDDPPLYLHTQKAPTVWLLAPFWLLEASVPMFVPLPWYGDVIFWSAALVLLAIGWHFSSLTVRGDARELRVWFGAWRGIGFRVPYSEMRTISADRTNWLDGWGLKYVRGGWLCNLWGFDCVRIVMPRRVLRIGTDDSQGLLVFLQQQLSASPVPPAP